MLTPTQQLERVVGGRQENDLLNAFFVLYKNARIMEANNRGFKRQAELFHRRLSEFLGQSGDLSIKVISGRYFVDEKLVRFDDQGLSGASMVVAEWDKVGIGGVEFSESLTLDNVELFFKFMAGIRPDRDNLENLSARLKHLNIPGIGLLSAKALDGSDAYQEVRRQFRTAARRTFFRAINVVEQAVADTENNREVNISKTKRVVHSLIDHIIKDEASMLELTAIKNFDDYTYAHSTNVCVYSLTLGVRMGMDRPRLSQLGFSALFHDIGKIKLPSDLVRKPDAFDENDWVQMQRHPLLGAKTILRNMKLDTHTARAARAAFEHHISNEFQGYPVLRYKNRKINLFSQIVAIADSFDALCSGRVYLAGAGSPDEALRKMHFQMKTKFDPFLLRLFTNVIGVYPAGSLVLLSSEEIAMVLTANESDRARPYVMIVGNREGLLPSPEWIDLSLPQHHDRKILRYINPQQYGLDIKDFVLKD